MKLEKMGIYYNIIIILMSIVNSKEIPYNYSVYCKEIRINFVYHHWGKFAMVCQNDRVVLY